MDCHLHSVRSDGVLSLGELAGLARRSGLAAIVITDHDVLPEPTELGVRNGVELLAGVELTTDFESRTLHILGYGFDPTYPPLIEHCQRVQAIRRERYSRMVEILVRRQRLARVQAEEALSPSCRSPGKRHLARALVRARRSATIQAAVRNDLLDLEGSDHLQVGPVGDVVELLHHAGGVASLAHPPVGMSAADWRVLRDTGLDAIETRYPAARKGHRRFLADRAAEHGWFQTAGSDFHGDRPSPWLGQETVPHADFLAWLSRTSS